MKISSSTIATLAITATAIGGAAFGISAAINSTGATSPQVVTSPNVASKIANPDTSPGQIASVTPTTTPTPTVSPNFGSGGDDDSTNTNPVNPNTPSFGGGSDDFGSDDNSYQQGDDSGSDDNSNYGDDSGSDDNSNYGDDNGSDD